MTINKRIISKNFTTGRGGKQVCRITMHTAVSNSTSLYSWFNGNATSSTHLYVNKVGTVEQYVEFSNTAWGNANWESNIRSISIEHWDGLNASNVERTPELYEYSAQLIAFLCKEFNLPCQLVSKSDAYNWNVKGIDLHNYFVNKSCPGGLDVNRIIKRANEILNINIDTMDEKIVINGTTLTKADCFRICDNLAGVKSDRSNEWAKWKANFQQGVVDLFSWKGYKNDTVAEKMALQAQVNELTAKNNQLNQVIATDTQTIDRLKQDLINRDLAIADLEASIKQSEVSKDDLLKQLDLIKEENANLIKNLENASKERDELLNDLSNAFKTGQNTIKVLTISLISSAILGLFSLLFRGTSKFSKVFRVVFHVLAILLLIIGISYAIYLLAINFIK